MEESEEADRKAEGRRRSRMKMRRGGAQTRRSEASMVRRKKKVLMDLANLLRSLSLYECEVPMN